MADNRITLTRPTYGKGGVPVKPYEGTIGATKPSLFTALQTQPPTKPLAEAQGMVKPPSPQGFAPTYTNYRDLYNHLNNGLATGQAPQFGFMNGYNATQAGYLPSFGVRGGQGQAQVAPKPVQEQQGASPFNGWQGMGQRGGGFEGDCVAVGSYLSNGMKAEQLPVGALYDCHHPLEGFHKSTLEAKGQEVLQPCVLLTTDEGAQLVCSITTPFNFVGAGSDLAEGGYALAPDMLGHDVFVRRADGVFTERVVAVDHVGEQLVIPLSFGGRSFPAGVTPDALIYSHNIQKAHNASDTIGRMQGLLAGYNFTPESSIFGNSHMIGAQNPYAQDPNSYGGGGSAGAGVTPSSGQQPTNGLQYDAQGNIIAPTVPLPSNIIPQQYQGGFFSGLGNWARNNAGNIGRGVGGLLLGPIGALGGGFLGNQIGGKKP